MNNVTQHIGRLLAPCLLILPLAGVQAGQEGATPAIPAAQFYPLIGNWKGTITIQETGQAPAELSGEFNCKKASLGWAVSCEFAAKNDQFQIGETHLWGVDPVSGGGHWYAVNNMGETHDHATRWVDAKTLKANYAWQQEGRQMAEEVTISLAQAKAVTFQSVVTADGQQMAMMTGKMSR